VKSLRRKAWRNFVKLSEKLGIPYEELERLVSQKGEHVVGDFILRAEGEVRVEGQRLLSVSLWKAGVCHYKGTVNPYLFEVLRG